MQASLIVSSVKLIFKKNDIPPFNNIHNQIYDNISLNFYHIPEGMNIENELAVIDNTYEEYAVIPSDNVMPHIDIQTLLNSDIPRLSLKRCRSTPLNAYDTPKGEEMEWHTLICFHKVL